LRELLDRGEALVTTRFTAAEFYVGVCRARDPEREEETVQQLLRGMGILEFGDREARIFGGITAHLQDLGRPAGDMDVLIAAVALANGHHLVSDNAGHFADIPNLAVETY
jgi:predicted nucleic acid-binding protein